MEARVDAAPAAAEVEQQRLREAAQLEMDEDDLKPRPLRLPPRRPVLAVLGLLVLFVLLLVLPPLVSVNRYRRNIAQSIGQSLGRPVRIDAVRLQLLPSPGFALDTFVVGEDPAFGSEPVIRAQTVTVRLRASSLWRRRLEFSSISLEDPSVNLVRRPDGVWNFESILLQASRLNAAPTAQRGAGSAPRFPYIEARGARVNIKFGLRKLPIALTDSRFALWLPESDQWRVRLQGHLARTDVAVNDTGVFHVEGTLGKASSLPSVPVNMHADWTRAPLGGVSLVLLGRDASLRGDMDLTVALKGTLGANVLDTRLAVHSLRRADFVPDEMLQLSARCTARAQGVFARLEGVHCASPEDVQNPQVELAGQIPDLSQPLAGSAAVRVSRAPASELLTALRVVSSRVSPDLRAGGGLSGALQLGSRQVAVSQRSNGSQLPATEADTAGGTFALTGARLSLGDLEEFLSGVDISGTLAATGAAEGPGLTLTPVPLELGGPAPAVLTIACAGLRCTMHLVGPVLRSRLLELARALPQFGDGLEAALPALPGAAATPGSEQSPFPVAKLATSGSTSGEVPIHVDLVATRELGGEQTWQSAPAVRVPAPRHSHRR